MNRIVTEKKKKKDFPIDIKDMSRKPPKIKGNITENTYKRKECIRKSINNKYNKEKTQLKVFLLRKILPKK